MVVYNIQNLPAEMVVSATTNKAAKTVELQAAFEAAINSDIFMSFEEKVKSLLDALSIPISDDQSYNQFFIHSTKDLDGDAGKQSAKSGTVCILPTIPEIHAEAKRRYDDKAVKDKRREERKAAKAAKNAPAVQPAAS